MHEFPHYIFLDPPKTGTTFVSHVLAEGDDQNAFLKHKPARRRSIPDRFIFSTIRHPLDFYRSTYAYGMRKDGGGRKELYAHYGPDRIKGLFTGDDADFNEWCRLFLDAQERGHADFVPTHEWTAVGRYTYRFFKLALADPRACAPTHENILGRAGTWLPSCYLRTTHLGADLAALIRHKLRPHMIAPDRALRYCKANEKRNASPLGYPLSFEPEVEARVREREVAMFELWNSLSVNPDTGMVTSKLQGA